MRKESIERNVYAFSSVCLLMFEYHRYDDDNYDDGDGEIIIVMMVIMIMIR